MDGQYKRDDCYFCHSGDDVLQTHHIVPRRFGGDDSDENLVTVCPTCHQKIEQLYGKRFFTHFQVGIPEAIEQQLDAKATICPFCEQPTVPDEKMDCLRCEFDISQQWERTHE